MTKQDTCPAVERMLSNKTKQRRRRLREIVERITTDGGGLHMAENLPRKELYDRDRARAKTKGETTATTENRNLTPR